MVQRILAVVVLGSVGLLAAGCSSAPDMKEGRWEISSDFGMKGIPIRMPTISYTQCLDKANFIPRDQKQMGPECSVTEQQVEGDMVRWQVTCDNGTTQTISKGLITYSGVLFSGTIDVTINGGPVAMNATSTVVGKYLGPCSQQ